MKVKTISGKNGKVVLPDGSTISHTELEKEADKWASGEIQAKTIRQLVGRPRLGEDIGKVMYSIQRGGVVKVGFITEPDRGIRGVR